jgi:hypothetical protein
MNVVAAAGLGALWVEVLVYSATPLPGLGQIGPVQAYFLKEPDVNFTLPDGLKDGHFLGFINVHWEVVDVRTHQSHVGGPLGAKEISLVDEP